jgi:hypothetical protein
MACMQLLKRQVEKQFLQNKISCVKRKTGIRPAHGVLKKLKLLNPNLKLEISPLLRYPFFRITTWQCNKHTL